MRPAFVRDLGKKLGYILGLLEKFTLNVATGLDHAMDTVNKYRKMRFREDVDLVAKGIIRGRKTTVSTDSDVIWLQRYWALTHS